ncbi:hypothetical protein AG1IA_00678 [Rhizoctonia solani AG-1 IA]|uniref:Uncharacterized protein n=1 Tax=Thanatephorus cucumeris (strain AG1-IA) TaxID=983506 RepID=L8X891_THACA|nr:hypothetical protein AG1IA_00678 [Rhizoctonia solani AG-1 IA]
MPIPPNQLLQVFLNTITRILRRSSLLKLHQGGLSWLVEEGERSSKNSYLGTQLTIPMI